MTIKVEAYGIRRTWASSLSSTPSMSDINDDGLKNIYDNVDGLDLDVDEEIDECILTDVEDMKDEDNPKLMRYHFDILLTVDAKFTLDTDDILDPNIKTVFDYCFDKVFEFNVTRIQN